MRQIFHKPGLRPRLKRIAAILLAIQCISSVFGAGVYATDVAVFLALDADLQTLRTVAKPLGSPVKIGTRTVQRFELGAHRIYAIKMGSGAVETAVSATALLTRYHCDLAFSMGPVGALDDGLRVGQWYQVDGVVPYQKGSWNTGGFQPAPASLESKAKHEPLSLGDKLPALLATAKPIKVASGEIFVASSSYRAQLGATTGAQAVDMNLFGLEAVCADQDVPLLSWRVVSDKADDQAGESFRDFVAHYDGAGGRMLAEVIQQLPASLSSPEAYPELRRLLGQPVPAAATPKPAVAPDH